MIEIDIPGFTKLTIEHLLCDYNGTLATDGQLAPSTAELLLQVQKLITVHVITAGTHGGLEHLRLLGIPVIPIQRGQEAAKKAAFLRRLGAMKTVVAGNGANDLSMFKEAALSIAVLGDEGLYAPLFSCSHIVAASSDAMLKLLLKPLRLVATLRR